MPSPYVSYAAGLQNTVQTQPIPGRESEMVANNAGGFSFVLDDWKRLERILILGSDGGTYYVGEHTLTAQCAECIIRCVRIDGPRVVAMAHDINVANRAPKVDSQLFALALALKYGDTATKEAASRAARAMLRTGTHLLHFTAMLDSLGGWNRSKRRVIKRWFEERSSNDLAFQVLKYQNRDSWRMLDVICVAHPSAPTPEHRAIYDWICGRENEAEPNILHAHRFAMSNDGSVVDRAIGGILAGLPREALPTEALNDPQVWRTLLPNLPLHALLRNLGNLSAAGVLVPGARDCNVVVEKLTNAELLRKSRVHPFAILLATLVYKQGSGVRGNKTWIPVPAILAALEDAYDLAFENVQPTNKRLLVAIDISGSMTAPCIGTPIPASTAAVAMAITLARLEPNALVVQFDMAVQRILPITKRTGIASLESSAGGGTDVSAPIRWSTGIMTEVGYSTLFGGGFGPIGKPASQLSATLQTFDAFVILTDNETWAGKQHASQALDTYRKKVNPYAKLVCCAMAANHVSVVDPTDALSFGCAGLDANLPALVSDFIE